MDSSVIAAAISGAVTLLNVVFTAVFNTIRDRRQKKSSDERYIEDGLQCLLRSEIIRAHEKYTVRGYCPIYAKESLRRVYTAYHNLGGNDIATSLYNECLNLTDNPDIPDSVIQV